MEKDTYKSFRNNRKYITFYAFGGQIFKKKKKHCVSFSMSDEVYVY